MNLLAIELEIIRTSQIPSEDQTNIRHVSYGEEVSILTYGESSSTFLSFNDRIT